MKNKTLKNILLALLICITACYTQKSDLYNRLEQIDSVIINKNEAAAMQMYDTLCIDGATDDERAYYNLLTVKLFCFNPPTPLDSIMDITEQYYRNHNDNNRLIQFLFCKSAYLFGKEQYQLGKKYLLEAERIAISYGDNYSLARINWLKVSVCSIFNDYEDAKVYVDRQLMYAEESGSVVQRSYAWLNKAILYQQLCMNDSASEWFHKVLSDDKHISMSDKSYIYNMLGELLLNTDSLGAENYFIKSLQCSPNPMAECNIARLCLSSNRLHEADSIASANINCGWAELDIDFLDILMQCQLRFGDTDSALVCSQMIAAQKDSVIERIMGNKTHLFDSVDSDFNNSIWYWLAVFVLLAFICVYYIKCRKHSESKKKLAKLEHQKAVCQKFNKVGIDILTLVNNNKRISESNRKKIDFLKLYLILDNSDLCSKIEKAENVLSESEYLYFLLDLLGKNNAEIAEILSITSDSVRTLKSRVKQKLNHLT